MSPLTLVDAQRHSIGGTGLGMLADGDVIAGIQKSARHNELVREQDRGYGSWDWWNRAL